MYCNTLVDPLITKIEIEKKTLDQIAAEVCGNTVKNPRQKIIRIIKLLLGNKYLIKHAQTLGYHPEKAVRQKSKSTTDEVVKGKILTQVEDSNNSGQTNGTLACQTALKANTKHEDEAGQTKGQEQVLDKPAVFCQTSSKAIRGVRKTDSENITEEELGEKTEPEKGVEGLDDAPVINVSDELVNEIKRLIGLFSLEEVKKALAVAECDI